jgi:MFS family permease
MSPTVADSRREWPQTTATPDAPGHIPGPDGNDQPGEAQATQLSSRPSRRRTAFWLLAFVFAATMFGTTLPTPLYVIYQARWHFSAAMVTMIFAVYAAAVLAALLLAGRSSDQAGRRPVLAVALGAAALSTVAFILAPDEWVLLAGRALSGLAAGLMTGTATAAYLAVLAAAGGCLMFIPETVSLRHRPALRFAGLGIPERGRGQFIAAAVAGFAAFALLGLFSSLAPGFIGGVLHQGSHAVQGAVVFGMFAVGTITQVALSRFPSRRVVLAGLGLFLASLALILTALTQAAMGLFLAGTAVGGVAVGAIFLGSLATANSLAPPGRRGHVVSTFFVACYAGLIIPVIGAGMLSGFTGTFPAVLAFALLLAILCGYSLARTATTLIRTRR